ncbi:MAG: protein-glutamate O-methyltransferase CheR [Acidobacteriales bacterium]|nr:protein-glutamate O-methyltransferase CheR [Terriglobales bacterium]
MAGRSFSIPAGPFFDAGSAVRAPGSASNSSAISSDLFSKFRAFLYEEAGLWLGSTKAGWLAARLTARMHAFGLGSLHQYYEAVVRPHQWQERMRLLDAIADPDPRFFREPRHFDFLMQRLAPRWREEAEARLRPRRLRVWSAACGGGEEPYSLAMCLLHCFPPEQGWELAVLATDVSSRLLDRAREGMYSAQRSNEIPDEWLRTYMLRGLGEQEGLIKAGPALRRVVRFEDINLIEDPYPLSGVFDLIFCRNVLVYFDQALKKRVVEAVTRHLSPRGFLVAGAEESLSGLHPRLQRLISSIYGETGDQGRLLYDFRATRSIRG